MRWLLLWVPLVAITLLHKPGYADEGALIFRRDVVTIVPDGYDPKAAESEASEEEKEEEPFKPSKKLREKMAKEEVIFDASKETKKEEKSPPPKIRRPVKINAEIRSDQALQLEWIASLNRLVSGEGVMIIFNPAIKLPLLEMNVYDAVDVLFVDSEGTILQIAPELTLYGLREEIVADSPIRAWFFLKGGDAEKNRIEPGDRIQHPLFSPKALILH